MSRDTEDVVGLTERLQTEADLCRNDGADDIAALLDEAASDRQSLSDRIDVLEGALKPFADCVDQIAADEDDEEWARFRLLIKDYRRAAAAFKRPHFERCPTCGGEFDEGEWNASSECPECETPIVRAALHQEHGSGE